MVRRRLRAVAGLAGMSEIEALKTIVETSRGIIDGDIRPASTKGPL